MPNPLQGAGTKLALIIAAIVAITVLLTLTIDSCGDDPAPAPTVTTKVDGPDADRTADDKLTAPAPAVNEVKAGDAGEHDGLRDETPPGITDTEVDQLREEAERLAETDQLPVVTPLAAPEQRGCRSRFVANKSSRRGVRPRQIWLHITVSANRPGWGDVDAITSYFNSPSSGASSNYVVDAEGHCNYIVRESEKAWTQAAANPFAISIEIINTGREGRLVAPAGLAKLALVIDDIARRWEIPIKRGKITGCRPVGPGIVQHADGGQCAGGHVDIGPYQVNPVIIAVRRRRLEREHGQVHARIRRLCTKAEKPQHPKTCRSLARRNRALHKAGVKAVAALVRYIGR